MNVVCSEAYPLDRGRLNDLRAKEERNQDVIGEMLDALLKVAPPLLDKIRSAAAHGDHETLYHSASSLKGHCAAIGAVVVTARLKELERMGGARQSNGVAEKIAQIDAEFMRAVRALRMERAHN